MIDSVCVVLFVHSPDERISTIRKKSKASNTLTCTPNLSSGLRGCLLGAWERGSGVVAALRGTERGTGAESDLKKHVERVSGQKTFEYTEYYY